MKKTNRILSVLLTLCMILGMFPGTALAAQDSRFSDVGSSAWYAQAVEYVYEKGLMSGTGDGAFDPDGTMSRAMIVTILYGMEGKPAVSGGSFYDVPKGQWYADAVAWASANGIVSGYGGGLFGPNDLITREQMAAILYSYAKFKGYDVSAGDKIDLTVYSDYDKLAAWAIPGMQWACGVGLISGVGGSALDPQGGATRGQAAVIFRSMDINVVEVEKAKAEKEKDKDKKPTGGGISGGGSSGGNSGGSSGGNSGGSSGGSGDSGDSGGSELSPYETGYDTTTYLVTGTVNRGLGRVNVWLTDGTDSKGNPIEDFAGNLFGFVDWDWENPDGGYNLCLSGDFYDTFWNGEEEYSSSNYDTIRMVITPFAGENFTTLPTVSALYWDVETYGGQGQELTVAAEFVDGNIVLTCDRPKIAEDGMEFYLELNGVCQEIYLNGIGDFYSGEEGEFNSCEFGTWEETLEALTQDYDEVIYTGAYNITLDTELILPPGVDLVFAGWEDDVSLTIVEGGKLILEGDSEVYVYNGTLTVEDGGVLTTKTGDTAYHAYVGASYGITVKDGGQICVEQRAGLTLNNGEVPFFVEEGGSVLVQHYLYLTSDLWDEGYHTINGRIDCLGESAELEVWTPMTITDTGKVYVSGGGEMEVQNGLIVKEGGLLQCEVGEVELYGDSVNYGTMIINGGELLVRNWGYSVTNSGSIQINTDSDLVVDSTVLKNTGEITGGGYLVFQSEFEILEYDIGVDEIAGTDWENPTPWDYDHNEMVRDPEATAQVLYYMGEVRNLDGGICNLIETVG